MQKGRVPDKRPRTIQRVTVSERRGLGDELQARRLVARCRPISFLITGTNHHADLIGASADGFLDDDLQG